MADWVISTWWCARSRPQQPDDRSDDVAAVRTGRVGDRGLWQMDVLSRSGFHLPRLRSHPQVVGVAMDQIFTSGSGPLVPGFNFVRSRPGGEDVAGWLTGMKAALPGAQVVIDDDLAMLCLPAPLTTSDAQVEWSELEDGRKSAAAQDFCDAVALAAPRRHDLVELTAGLWTAEYGYLHTGRLAIRPRGHLAQLCTMDIELTGVCQELDGETRSGTHRRSNHFLFDPVPSPRVPWPLRQR